MADYRKTPSKPPTVSGLGTGLTVSGPQNVTYESALEAARKSQEYQTLLGVIEDPYIIGDNYQWLVDFLEKRATKFWRYLKIREAGKVDNDIIRAANILEYARLVAKLVSNYPEFSGKILPQVSRQFPEDFPPGQVINPAELVQKLEKLNQQDFLEPKSGNAAAPGPTPPVPPTAGKAATGPASKTPGADRKKITGERSQKMLEELLAGIDEEVNKNLPQFSGFSLDAKCSLLGLSEWTRIISPIASRYPEFAGASILQVAEAIAVNNQDPRIGKIYALLKQMLS